MAIPAVRSFTRLLKHRTGCFFASRRAMAASPHLVGVIQMTCTNRKDENFKEAKELIEKAAKTGAKMIFLPECFDYIGDNRDSTIAAAESSDGTIISNYKNVAKELGIWLSLGGFHEKSEEASRVRNTHVIIDNTGEIKGRYSKTHLFEVDIPGKVRLKESDFTIPGSQIGPPVQTPIGQVGMAICYDMRFPELSIALAQQGAEILTYPSAFTVPTGMAHWESLLRSRAIENQCYVIAAAQVGKHNEKRSSYGHSMVVDPWGSIIAKCSDKVGFITAEIDQDYLAKIREDMPVWHHRRHDLYGHLQVPTKGDLDDQKEYKFGQVSIKASSVVYKTALSYVIVNKKPVLPGHLLVCPLQCVERFADLSSSEVADLFSCTQKVSKMLESHFSASATTIAIQDGEDAGQTIKHVHVHILPRKSGDFKKNDDIYEALQKHDKDVDDSKYRSEEEMSREASLLRPYFK